MPGPRKLKTKNGSVLSPKFRFRRGELFFPITCGVARARKRARKFWAFCLKVLKSALKSDRMAAWRLGLKVLKVFS